MAGRVAIDADGTLLAVPGLWRILVDAWRKSGVEVWCLSRNPDAAGLLAAAHIEVDHVAVVNVDKTEAGEAKARFLAANHCDALIDNSPFAPEVTNVCSFLRFHPGPTGWARLRSSALWCGGALSSVKAAGPVGSFPHRPRRQGLVIRTEGKSMPLVPQPAGDANGLPHFWSAFIQNAAATTRQAQQLVQGAQQTNVTDGWGNVTAISGRIAEVVTIGAGHNQPGVLVATPYAASSGTTGLLVQVGSTVTTLISTTAGSISTTVSSATGLASGMAIGAADVSDPESGMAEPCITPGTTIASITGTSVVLSQAAVETGKGVYCAACSWSQVT